MEITSAANASAKSMTDSAQEEAADILRRASEAAQAARGEALADLQGEVVELAFGIATKVLRREAKNADTLSLAEAELRAAQGGAAS
jgi:F0F1-type ATP synthase membrane subunit b/b'